MIPIEPDPGPWEINESRYGRYNPGTVPQETGPNAEAMGVGVPCSGGVGSHAPTRAVAVSRR